MANSGNIYQRNQTHPSGLEGGRPKLNRDLTEYYAITDMFGYELANTLLSLRRLRKGLTEKPVSSSRREIGR